jgi:transposase
MQIPVDRRRFPRSRSPTRWPASCPGSGDESHAAPARQEHPQRPELQAVAGHVRDFADLMNKHRGERLPDWMLRAQADNLPALHSLVTGLHRDLDAVTAGLTMIWSSGPVEAL